MVLQLYSTGFRLLMLFFSNQKTPQQPDTVPLPDFIVFFQNERYNPEFDSKTAKNPLDRLE